MTAAKILLVDADVEAARVAQELCGLRRCFTVTVTNNAEASVAAALSDDHVLAVLDVMMPRRAALKR